MRHKLNRDLIATAIDPTYGAPVALSYPNRIVTSAHWADGGVVGERCSRKLAQLLQQRRPLTHRHSGKALDRGFRENKVHEGLSLKATE